ncbi:lytic transglycosylase domain-containing protein [Donghicola mangrovi]|uniref:Lytic transglycosylase domain-containing protein n=1 Tax=Donghicola mangrovi TaxID=2729614 RepID=A0A850Q8N3_9RHOB|nr:lytic transglycosylase domain-containing protein [Donghicola mangrovi]NVO22331.1 lytic transglycosylase domain-containing protein [Donghicola mangrovi]
MTEKSNRWWYGAVFCAVMAPSIVFGQGAAPRPLDGAMDAVRAENWPQALTLARQDSQVATDIVMWHYLREGEGTVDQIMDFLARRADWPGIALLKKRSEKTIASQASANQILQFFQGNAPQTGAGALAYAEALTAAGDRASADAVLVRAWLSLDMDQTEHDAFMARYSGVLSQYHTARMDMLLWGHDYAEAGRMMALVSADWRALAAARIALQTDKGDVNALINAVPNRLGGDPGMAHDRFQWRIDKNYTDSARDLLLERSARPELLGKPQEWAGMRRILVRREMREGVPAVAYRLAAEHHLTSGSDWVDLEWLAGYIALRFLNDPARALAHFKSLAVNVDSPISKGRAGYWIGRAYDDLGDTTAAQMAYQSAGTQQTSFYGLLAAEKAGMPFDKSLAGGMPRSDWRQASFVRTSLFEAAVMLIQTNDRSVAERFVVQLSETLTEPDLVALGDAMLELNEPHLAVMVGKEAASKGIVLPRAYYALHPIMNEPLDIKTEWALSIARRESEFDPWVVSPVGARGLMQLMPKTAEAMAKVKGVPYRERALLAEPVYNATLGSAYLVKLAREFGGNPMFMAAGYNAGPGRPARWIEQFGDPRTGAIDPVDWVEMIPFNETRNYIMRVTESLPVYRARLGKDPLPVPFSQELKR